MIIYFSATGNCEFAAKRIAQATNDNAISIEEIKENIALKENESLGFVFPTYFWGLPSLAEDFLKKTEIKNAENSYIFFVATYGGTSGQINYYANRILKKKGIGLSASFGIKTVDNWTVWYNANDKSEIEKTLSAEEKQIDEIIAQVKNKNKISMMKDKKSKLICFGAKYFYNKARKTSHLNVAESCIGCGLCERKCPVGAIKLSDGKPIWIREECTMCFRCLHNCPKFAINYDNKTQKNGQYKHP